MELNWETPITISVSDNMTIFKAAKLPFKNIIKVACTNGVKYSASTFKSDKRDYAHWNTGAQIIVLDFDEGLNELSKSWLNSQFGFLLPTRHHNISKNGKLCERYRAILLTETPMTVSQKEYVRIYQNIIADNNLPGDTSCTDVSRFYYSFSSPESIKDIKVLSGKPLDWAKYNYENNVEMIGLPRTPKVVDISEYETKVDLRDVPNMNHSKRYECPICALEGLDPNKHHLGFSPEKDLLTCFYDKEGHSPILRALYRKQVLGLDPEIDEDCQEVVIEEIKQSDGKVKKKRTVKPKMEECSFCKGTGKITCTDCGGSGFIETNGTQTECGHCKGVGFFPCPECQGTGKVPKKPKPRVKKPSLPDEKIPTRKRNVQGEFHFNELGATLDFDAEVAKYKDAKIVGLDLETYYDCEVSVSEDEVKKMFKGDYISISATYKRVIKNIKDKAKDSIDNTVRLFTIGTEEHQTAFDLSILTPDQKKILFSLLQNKIVVAHNIKFDLKSLASEYGIDVLPTLVFDTMLGSKMLWMAHNSFEPNGTNSYGSVVERFCGVHLPKDQGGSDWGASKLSTEQLIYAVNDVKYLVPVFKKMAALFKEEMKDYHADTVNWKLIQGILGPFQEIHPVMALEMKFVLSLIKMELKGVMINESTIRDIVKEHLDEIKEAENTLGFNPASNPSCLKFVKQVIGPHMTSASKEALAEYYSIPEVALLGKAKQAKARAGLLVKMYDKKADGRIHSIFTQILSTARLASKEPNMQQIPRTVKAHIYRAPKGRTVFSADYPAIELRLASVWHKEPVMLEAFKNGEDLHYRMAQLMTGKKIPHTDEEKHDETGTFINKEERTAAKNVNFGYIYGSWWTSYQQIQLVKNHTKISDADAQKTRSDFMGLYKVICKNVECAKYRFKTGKPRVSKQIDSFGNEYTTQLPYMEEVCTLFGRRLAVETANTALNYGIQGSGGDACKLAVCIFDEIVKKENIDAYIVNLIHDDIVVESSIEDKERAHKALATAMNTAADCMMGCYFNTDVSEEIETLAETPIEN